MEPGGNILFVGTVLSPTLDLVSPIVEKSHVVLYGVTEGHSFLDKKHLKIAREIKIIAASNFAKQMPREIGISVAGVVHHGLDMEDLQTDARFYNILSRWLIAKRVILAVAANHSRRELKSASRIQSHRTGDEECFSDPSF